MPLTRQQRATKLQKLAELLGFETVDEMFDAAVTDTACPGICVNPWCDYTPTVAPDDESGYCPNAARTPCKAVSVLAGLI